MTYHNKRQQARAVALRQEQDTARRYWVMLTAFALAICFALVSFGMNAFAAGSSDSGSSSNASASVSAEMRKAEILIKRESYAEALVLLKEEVAANPDNADAWNLLGYSARKQGDYAASEIAYDKALAIEPGHKGALEYKGELYLTLGNLEGAEMLLGKLRKLCSFNCGEVKDLEEAIAAYKKNL